MTEAAAPGVARPVVVWAAGADDPARPLVVLLHGRGADEVSILGLAAHLPAGPSYAAVRAPIAEGGGYAWFANRDIGRPVAASLAATTTWFRAWLDGVAPPGRPVVLVGFSGGAAFAGGLLLGDPHRFAGTAVLHGTLPFDAGLPVDDGRLAGAPVLVAQGEADAVIPRELLERTWSYLTGPSGALATTHRGPEGHGLTADAVAALAAWIATLPALVAADLRAARAERRTLAPFTDAHPGLTEAWGYAVQDAQHRTDLAAGARPIGAKLGLTSEAKQRRMGVERPIIGRLVDRLLLAADEVGDALPRWAQPRVEPEIAVVTARALGRGEPTVLPGAGGAEAVAQVLLAAEVLDSRYPGYRFGLADVVADDTSAAGVVLGPERRDPHDLADLAALACEVRVDGEVVHRATGAAVLGHPLRALALLAEHLDRRGETLPAGSLVLLGALTDAVPLETGHRYELAVQGLGAVRIDA